MTTENIKDGLWINGLGVMVTTEVLDHKLVKISLTGKPKAFQIMDKQEANDFLQEHRYHMYQCTDLDAVPFGC